MPSKIVNLTAYIVVESIKNILEDCLEYPYQMMFSVSYYRQRLIAQTLSSIKNSYVVIQDTEELDELDVVRLHTLQEHMQIGMVIIRNMLIILEDEPDWEETYILQNAQTEPDWKENAYRLAEQFMMIDHLPCLSEGQLSK